MKTITEDQWYDLFQPEELETAIERDFNAPEIKQALAEKRLWTMVEDDNGDMCITQGHHVVNRLYYIICEIPYDEEYMVEMENISSSACFD